MDALIEMEGRGVASSTKSSTENVISVTKMPTLLGNPLRLRL
jgi:hypothetical protein